MRVREKGANLRAVSADGNNALHYLILTQAHDKDDYKKTVSLFIEKAPQLIDQKNSEGYKPFHYAVQKRCQWSAQRLLDAGADAFEKDPDGNNPLHHLSNLILSSSKEVLPWFKSFHDLGISINEKNDIGETPVFRYFRAEASRMATANSLEQTYLPFSDAGADVFVRINDGETLLHVVAKKVSRDVARQNVDEVVKSFEFLLRWGWI